jgi:selenocysteine lyase/cysteine desulfurase
MITSISSFQTSTHYFKKKDFNDVVRISFHYFNKKKEVDYLVSSINNFTKKIK